MALGDLYLPGRVPQLPAASQNFDEILRRWRDLQAMETALLAADATFQTIVGLKTGVFSVYRNVTQSLAVGSAAAIVFDTEERDLNNWHDVASGKYTPQVAGYYRLNAGLGVNQVTAAGTRFILSIFKNGADHKRLQIDYSAGGDASLLSGSVQVQANGTTDFFTVVLQHNLGVALATAAGPTNAYFQGELIAFV
jgi:hypothetical protein